MNLLPKPIIKHYSFAPICQLYLLGIVVFFFLSCDEPRQTFPEKKVFVQSVMVPDTVKSSEIVTIKVELSVSGCWTFSRFNRTHNEKSIVYEAFVKNPAYKNEDLQCPTGLFTELREDQVTFKKPGEIYFVFNDSSIVKKTIIENP